MCHKKRQNTHVSVLSLQCLSCSKAAIWFTCVSPCSRSLRFSSLSINRFLPTIPVTYWQASSAAGPKNLQRGSSRRTQLNSRLKVVFGITIFKAKNPKSLFFKYFNISYRDSSPKCVYSVIIYWQQQLVVLL